MKISATLFLASIGSTSAFLASVAEPRCMPLRMSDPRGGKGFGEERVTIEGKNLGQPKMSQSIPFVKCPPALDGSMAGDVGFDPLGFAKSQMDVTTYRESEIKHGRLAMMAAAGWPVSELFDKKIADQFGWNPLVDENNRVPSILNGGMGKVSPVYWLFCILLGAATELYWYSLASKKEGYVPGDLGFDPFGLFPQDEKGKKWMQGAEIKHGRLAMIAITAFALQEFVSHVAVVDQTPFFFKPIWQVLSDNVPSYIIPPEETPAIFEGVVPPLDAAVTNSAEAATTFAPPVDAVSAASVEAPSVVSPPVVNEELIAAKKRIAELESKLSVIGDLTR